MIEPRHWYLVPVGQSRISRPKAIAIMRSRAAPAVLAERDPGEYYDAAERVAVEVDGILYQVDFLFLLAMFEHESSMGRAGAATTTRSWGNTRPPSFGAPEIGRLEQWLNGQLNGYFSKYGSWLDGLGSTAARLLARDYVYLGWGRRTIESIFRLPDDPTTPGRDESLYVWAPAGDFNNPAGYLRSVVDFMNLHGDRLNGEQPVSKPIHVGLSPGHWDNTGDSWGGVERARTMPLARTIEAEALRRGFRVTFQPDDTHDLHYRQVAQWFAARHSHDPFDLIWQVHFQGEGSGTDRGPFIVYPDNAARGDHDLDVKRLGEDVAKRLVETTALPARRGGPAMSEGATLARELAWFSYTTNMTATTERGLMEYAASNSNLDDRRIVDSPGWYDAAARATVDAWEAFYGRQQPTVPLADEVAFGEVPYVYAGGIKGYWDMLSQTRHPGTDVAASILTMGLPRSAEFPQTLDGTNRVAQVTDSLVMLWQPDQPRPYDIRPALLRHVVETLIAGAQAGHVDLDPLGLMIVKSGQRHGLAVK